MTRYGSGTNASRNETIDIFRGSLALLVIMGHCAELTDRDNFLTWFGFGFRMPLFIGLSGFLFNLEQARSISFGTLIRKYYRRLLLPWGVACLFHLVVTQSVDWVAPLHMLVRPPYHLWFVPVMMTFIFLTKMLRMSATTMLGAAIPISIVAMYFFGVGHDIQQYHPWMPDRRYFIFSFYFTFGLWVARQPDQPGNRLLLSLTTLAGLVWWSWLYNHADPEAEVAAKLIICIPCIALFPLFKHYDLHIPTLAQVRTEQPFPLSLASLHIRPLESHRYRRRVDVVSFLTLSAYNLAHRHSHPAALPDSGDQQTGPGGNGIGGDE